MIKYSLKKEDLIKVGDYAKRADSIDISFRTQIFTDIEEFKQEALTTIDEEIDIIGESGPITVSKKECILGITSDCISINAIIRRNIEGREPLEISPSNPFEVCPINEGEPFVISKESVVRTTNPIDDVSVDVTTYIYMP